MLKRFPRDITLAQLEKIYPWLLGLKVFAAVGLVLLPINLPHVWRQIDTLSVAMRYWQRWTLQSDPYPLFPAVLNSGDFFGYVGMELPLLNILTAPAFAFGPSVGSRIAFLILAIVNVSLWLWTLRIWRGITIAGVDAARAFRWLPLFSVMAATSVRFIPDTTAVLLCLAGSGLTWHKRNWALALLLMIVGTLIKPPACVAFAVLLLHPNLSRDIIRIVLPPCAAIFIAAVYYLKAVPFLDALETNVHLFETNLRDPIGMLKGFAKNPLGIVDLVESSIFFQGATVLLPLMIWANWSARRVQQILPVLVLLALQFLAVILLVGDHLFKHSYYLTGLSPLAVLLVVSFFNSDASSRLLRGVRVITAVSLVILQVRSTINDLRGLDIGPPADRVVSFSECDSLKARLPELPWGRAAVFRTAKHLYPKLGFCFGERTGSVSAEYGIYYLNETLPESCKVLETSEHLQVVHCSI